MYPNVPKQVLRQFGYLEIILRDPTFDAHPIVYQAYVNEIFIDYYEHLVPKEV